MLTLQLWNLHQYKKYLEWSHIQNMLTVKGSYKRLEKGCIGATQFLVLSQIGLDKKGKVSKCDTK
jgi:hypothetical protein